ncbi:uncharacterized protein [Eucyclogobius newberryi]|uniref:uncharacterized protein n=1 Tax=Eucyclogobius newberryi TaxID=166745 RepID=UPI003B5C1531
MEDTYLLSHPGVKKRILAGGNGPLPHFPPGTKLVFHFQTLLDNFERTVIDDSRCAGRPAEIFVGKMFKLEVWETLLTSMRLGEVAEFWCDATHTGLYPIVSKGMRLIAEGKDPLDGQRHMCGMGNLFHYHSTGYAELDELMRTPQPLIFIMELLQVGDPMSYHRESWMMEKDEKLQTVPILHMQGNALVKQREFREAASKYKEAVLLLKTVQSREMPGDIDYINLGRMIIPLELNYCQCKLELEEYYEVIKHTSELLEKHKDCVKAYYKRAKAHTAVWNEKEARKDFNMVAQLDVTLNSLVHRELKNLSERMKEKYWEEKEAYWNKLENKEEKDECEETAETPPEEVCKDEAGDVEEQQLSETSLTRGKDWQQMLRLVMLLQKEGNFLITQAKFEEASVKFNEAIEYVDHLQNTQVDHEGDDWDSLEKVRLPVALNLSQCRLELKQHQQVVELNNKLLKKHKGNFKAIYQRARAHAALCNEDEARKDFVLVEKLDPKFKPIVRQELKKLAENVRIKHSSQNKNYWETTQQKWGPDGDKAKASTPKKKNVKFAQEETKEDQTGQVGIEKLPDEKTEACDECGGVGGLDNRKSVVEDVAANRDTSDKDSDPEPVSEGGDCSGTEGDKATEKDQYRSHVAPGPEKEPGNQTGDGNTSFEMSQENGAEAVTNEE